MPLPAPLAYSGAILSGLLYWLAFPGMEAWPLAFVAWVPLIVALRGQSPRTSAFLAWTSGLTMNLAGFSWLQGMLQTFSGFPAPLCFFFVFVICAYQGARVGLLGWLYGRATVRGWPAYPVFAGAFVASELIFPVLFPWSYAATVHAVPVLTQSGELGGPILTGLVLVAANLALAELVLALDDYYRRPSAGPLVAGVAAVACALGFGVVRIRAVDAMSRAAPASTVGVVQANMGLQQKRTSTEEGLRRHLSISHELEKDGADFVVWSETSAMRPAFEEDFRDELSAVARRIGAPAVFGAVIVRPVTDARRYVLYNTAVSSDADGAVGGRYDKHFLLMFGEYLPLGDVFPFLYRWSPNSGHFTPGQSTDALTLDVHGEEHRVTALICYEDVLPTFTNDAVRAGDPDLLVNMTNDAWFGNTTEPWEHLALAQLRAVEHRRYLVRGTNSGVSAVVDPVGRIVARSGTFTEEGLTATIHWMHPHTVYERIGDWPWWCVAALVVVGAFRTRRVRTPA